jgi:hypothetical protein
VLIPLWFLLKVGALNLAPSFIQGKIIIVLIAKSHARSQVKLLLVTASVAVRVAEEISTHSVRFGALRGIFVVDPASLKKSVQRQMSLLYLAGEWNKCSAIPPAT